MGALVSDVTDRIDKLEALMAEMSRRTVEPYPARMKDGQLRDQIDRAARRTVKGQVADDFGAAAAALVSAKSYTDANSGLSSSPTTGIGYKTGAGGAVTQSTNKITGVVLNTVCGQITMNAANLPNGATATFTLTNSTIAATDVVVVSIASGATVGNYVLTLDATAAGSCKITIRNAGAGPLAEAVVLNFAVVRAVAA